MHEEALLDSYIFDIDFSDWSQRINLATVARGGEDMHPSLAMSGQPVTLIGIEQPSRFRMAIKDRTYPYDQLWVNATRAAVDISREIVTVDSDVFCLECRSDVVTVTEINGLLIRRRDPVFWRRSVMWAIRGEVSPVEDLTEPLRADETLADRRGIEGEVWSFSMLSELFADASIVDIDVSGWRRRLRFVVVSSSLSGRFGQWPGIFMVDFVLVSEFVVEFPLAVPSSQTTWSVSHLAMEADSSEGRVVLSGSQSLPKISLRCRDVSVVELDHEEVRRGFPNRTLRGDSFLRENLRDGLAEYASRHYPSGFEVVRETTVR